MEPIASFPAGRYTWTTILDGLTVKYAVAQDAIGVESTNPADWKYSSLTGIAPAIDTMPPVMSNGQPIAHLPADTTLRFFVNNVLGVSTTDASDASGRPGLTIFIGTGAPSARSNWITFARNTSDRDDYSAIVG